MWHALLSLAEFAVSPFFSFVFFRRSAAALQGADYAVLSIGVVYVQMSPMLTMTVGTGSAITAAKQGRLAGRVFAGQVPAYLRGLAASPRLWAGAVLAGGLAIVTSWAPPSGALLALGLVVAFGTVANEAQGGLAFLLKARGRYAAATGAEWLCRLLVLAVMLLLPGAGLVIWMLLFVSPQLLKLLLLAAAGGGAWRTVPPPPVPSPPPEPAPRFAQDGTTFLISVFGFCFTQLDRLLAPFVFEAGRLALYNQVTALASPFLSAAPASLGFVLPYLIEGRPLPRAVTWMMSRTARWLALAVLALATLIAVLVAAITGIATLYLPLLLFPLFVTVNLLYGVLIPCYQTAIFNRRLDLVAVTLMLALLALAVAAVVLHGHEDALPLAVKLVFLATALLVLHRGGRAG